MLKKIFFVIIIETVLILFFYLYHINQINFLQRDINIMMNKISLLEDENKKYTILCLKQHDPQELLHIAKDNNLELLNKKNCITLTVA